MTPQEAQSYNRRHPWIYEMSESMCNKKIRQGATYLSMRGIFMEIRSVNFYRDKKDSRFTINDRFDQYCINRYLSKYPRRNVVFRRVNKNAQV